MKTSLLKAKAKIKVNHIRRRFMASMTKNIGYSNGNLAKPNHLDVLKVHRILICRPNSRLGNQLLITPLVQELLKTFPNAEIDLFVRGSITPTIFKNYDRVNQFISLPSKPFKSLISYIKVWMKIRKAKSLFKFS